MSDLATFSEHVQDVGNDAYRLSHWTPEEAAEYMASFAGHRREFEKLTLRLNQDVVKPRIEVVARFFSNAHLSEAERPSACSCRFDYCKRFPVNAEVGFGFEYSIRFDHLFLKTRTHIMPVFVRYNEQDRLAIRWGAINNREIADWVEERLLEFIDTYSGIDAIGDRLDGIAVTDPVCGMRLRRSDAECIESHHGHPYHFCCENCRGKFLKDPNRFARIQML